MNPSTNLSKEDAMGETRTKTDGQVVDGMEGGGVFADYAEVTSCSARWASEAHDFVDVNASGYIRTLLHDAVFLSLGWVEGILADNETVPAPAMVVEVVEVMSANAAAVPRTYTAMDFLEAPPQLKASPNPTVVFCYLEPGTPTDPPVDRKMKRIRVNVG